MLLACRRGAVTSRRWTRRGAPFAARGGV